MTVTMDTIATVPGAATRITSRPGRFSLKAMARTVIGRMRLSSQKRRSRSVLRDLTEDQLRDIGLTRGDVRREVAKSFFWD